MLPADLESVPTEKGFCSFPWESITIHWNGDCSVCCLDYNREISLGSVLESSIEEIHTGKKITEIRDAMEKGIVSEPLCQICLGGLRDRNTGKMIRKPQSSKENRLLNSVTKYGVVSSARYLLQACFHRRKEG